METSQPLLIRRALILEYLTVAWNVIEAIIAIGAGITAGSIALVGFGLDSIIEVTAAGAIIWRLKKQGDLDEESKREKAALKIVGLTFFALAAYISFESLHALWTQERPSQSLVGIILALASAVTMPVLGLAKRKVAFQIGSKALAADGMETIVCAYLSVALLVGLALNAIWGLWWADPVAGLVMVWFIVKEGREAFEGCNDCCDGK